MKKHYLFTLIFLFLFSISFSQTTLTVSDGSAEGPIPVWTYFGYSYGEVIYLQSEINSSGDIDQILLEWDGSVTESRSWKIFMGHTSKVAYSNTSDWVSSSGLTQVFNGTVSMAGIGSYFVPITLDTNFSYNGSDNLIIAIQDNTNDYTGSTSRFLSQASSDGNYRSIVKYSDSGAISTTSPPTASNRYTYTPSFKVRITAASPTISVGSNLQNLNYPSGDGPSFAKSTAVSGINLSANITVTAPTNFEVSLNGSSFFNSLTLTQSSGSVSSTTIYARLKSGLSPDSYSGDITISSTGASSQTISLSGTITSPHTNIYVDDSGNDDSNNGLSEAAPFATLAKAITTAGDGTGVTINIGAGTYTEHSLSLSKSNITIKGAGSSSTFFTSNTTNTGFMSITGDDIKISDMKISNYNFTSASSSSNAYGGGVFRIGAAYGSTSASASTSVNGLSLSNIIFYQNKTEASSGDGGALAFVTNTTGTAQTATITNCTFDGNIAGDYSAAINTGHRGGAINLKDGNDIIITNSLFFDNRSMGYAGAIGAGEYYGGGFPNLTIVNSVIYRNRYHYDTSSNGGIWLADANLYLYNSFVNYNYFQDSNSVIKGDINGNSGSLYTIRSSFITLFDESLMDSSDATTTDNEGVWPIFTDAGNDDFTLAYNSPAIGQASATFAPGTDINGVTRPQGSADDVGPYEYQNMWTGTNGTDWGTTSNWDQGYEPNANTESPIIADVINQPVISSDDGSSNDGNVTLNEITINSGAELTINKDASLTLSGDFTNNSGTVTLNSDSSEFASIIVQGSSAGDITYNRYVNSLSGGSGWDLVGSPVDGLSISSFASNNSSPLATGGGSGGNQYAIGYYDNSADDWTNYTTATIGSAGNFDIGKGYQMATDSGATLAFTGTIATSDQTQAVQDYSGASGRIWNLVSNPYPSYINANSNADGTNNIISVNGTSNLHDSYLAVYGYDADTSGDGSNFTIINNTSAATYIAPGQAFMLASDNASSGTSVSFTEAMQTTSGSNDFISDTMENTEVELRMRHGETEIGSTLLFFEDGLTLGLDPGWDAGHFDEYAPLMTRLIEEDEGYGMAINAMGLDAMENAVIPLVINQSAGQEFRINLFTATIPDPNVYLEDVEEGTFTNLYEEDFVYTPTTDLSGVGRFFIHMSADTMSNEEVSTSMLNAYKEIDASYITIEGLATQTNETNVSLYNILGRQVLSTTLNNNMSTQTISTVGLSAGIYVIELESGSDRLTKKIIIK